MRVPLLVLCLGTVSRDRESRFSESGCVCLLGTVANPHSRLASLLLRNLVFSGLGEISCPSSAIILWHSCSGSRNGNGSREMGGNFGVMCGSSCFEVIEFVDTFAPSINWKKFCNED